MWTNGHVYVFWDIIFIVICWDNDKYVSSFNMQSKKWKVFTWIPMQKYVVNV